MKIVIIGAGFGGIGLGVRLKRAGFHNFTILERGSEVGGVWRDNTYPGAACDVPSRLYSYSFASNYSWLERFGRQPEILGYLKYCAERFGIRDHIRFNIEVTEASFDTSSARWQISTADGKNETAEMLVSAVGLFNRALVPDLLGRDNFEGRQFHSSRWDHYCKMANKNVAVIGTGASAIQFVPQIAPEVRRLLVFQRSPQYVLPRDSRPVSQVHGVLDRIRRSTDRFGIYLEQERRSRRRGSKRMTEQAQAQFLARLEREIPDPSLRRKLTPSYPLGCKRVLQSNDWYPALSRENVKLIDSPVTELRPSGVITGDGEFHAADIIVYGTGFTPTRYLTPLKITGPDGNDLNRVWKNGAEAYLGMTVAGFPNFFMMYGPNTNIAGSIVYMLESQARYIVDAARLLSRPRVRQVSVRRPVQDAFNSDIQVRLGKTVLLADMCHSYFQDPSGKVTTQWPGFMYEYRRQTRRLKTADFEIK
ncbi:MAG: NAD(P)/FAD-dependent oxidoreductase [Pseudomonadota bacterium]|nr:NAD(P)/FAD-dependent oxidoreductase [Pseudomonadota bacterium]